MFSITERDKRPSKNILKEKWLHILPHMSFIYLFIANSSSKILMDELRLFFI